MHACGHDAHTAIMMATAEVLTGDEGRAARHREVHLPAGRGRAEPVRRRRVGQELGRQADGPARRIAESETGRRFRAAREPGLPAGQIAYRGGPARASADGLRIKVTGRQGHGGFPWRAIDPITTAAQIVSACRPSSAGAPN